jgi:peptidoglycan/xylan/chitin deacetylase (PgdA/CDA1 family)
LLRRRFDVIRPEQFEDVLREPRRRPAVLITFDDGYRDNYDFAVPALAGEGLAAAFFIATKPLETGWGLWTSELWRLANRLPAGPLELADGAPEHLPANRAARRSALRAMTRWLSSLTDAARESALDQLARRVGVPRGEGLEESFVTPAHLSQMRDAGMTIGAHTRSHPHLDRLDPTYHSEELASSRRDLERALGHPVTWFAYPNPGGAAPALESTRKSVSDARFTYAFTSHPGPIGDVDRLMVPRVGVYRGEQERLLFDLVDTLGRTS